MLQLRESSFFFKELRQSDRQLRFLLANFAATHKMARLTSAGANWDGRGGFACICCRRGRNAVADLAEEPSSGIAQCETSS